MPLEGRAAGEVVPDQDDPCLQGLMAARTSSGTAVGCISTGKFAFIAVSLRLVTAQTAWGQRLRAALGWNGTRFVGLIVTYRDLLHNNLYHFSSAELVSSLLQFLRVYIPIF
jgi:hypothetical protein